MRRASRNASLAICAAAAVSCSLALDFDALNAGLDTESESCSGAVDCDDGVACTADSCGADGACDNVPDNALCAPLEVCDLQDGCIPSGDVCDENVDCDDGVACTTDTCVLGQCSNAANDAYCESEDPCIVDEACDPAACASLEGCLPAEGCLPGVEKACEQSGVPCTVTECDSATADGACVDVVVAGSDDDGDTFLDATCGGDDCDDSNEAVHPGVDDPCNGLDDDCDGLADATAAAEAVSLATADTISSPRLAVLGEGTFVVWQTGSDGDGAVHIAQVSGDGSLTVAPEAFTSRAGADATGRAPDVAVSDDGVRIAWIASTPGELPKVVGMDVASSAGAFSFGDVLSLSAGAADVVLSPRIAWDGDGSGWIVAHVEGDASARTVELVADDMHGTSTTSFTVASVTGEADDVSLAVLGANRYAVAFAASDAASDGDLEVFASEVELAADAWANAAGFPLRISSADGVKTDPSTSPSLAAFAGGSWVAAFSSTDPDDSYGATDLVAYGNGGTTSLADEGSLLHREPSLVFDGSSFGLMYLVVDAPDDALRFLSLDTDLAADPAPYTGTEIAASTGANDTRGGALASLGEGRYAAVWLSRSAEQDRLHFRTFALCDAAK